MSLMVKTSDLVNGGLWKIFPVINVDRVEDIPSDYPGMMGVPVTYFGKHNPAQFELCGVTRGGARLENGREPYKRILIRHLHPDLPEEIDLAKWCRRCGMECHFWKRKETDMTVNKIFELGLIDDNTEIWIRDDDFNILAHGNWYQDDVLG